MNGQLCAYCGNLYFRAVKEVVRRRFELKDHEQKRDMMGSFIRHGISREDVVAEAALQM